MPLLNGVTSFLSQPVINSTILANTDNSSSIPTTSWTNAYWAYVKTNSNTWTAPQTFTTGIIMDNMSGSSATSAMKIGSNLTTGSITIGTATSTTTLSGITYINKIDTITPTSSNSIFESLTTANLAIADNIKGNVYIASNTAAGTNNFVIIGKGGGAASGTTNVYIKGKGVNLADDGGDVSICTTASGSLTVNRPITLGYTTTPTTGQLGNITSAYTASTLPLTTSGNYGYFNITTSGLGIGTHMCIVQARMTPLSGALKLSLNIGIAVSGLTVTGLTVNSYNAANSLDEWYSTTPLFVTVTNATTSYIQVQAYSQSANSTINSCSLYAMRIA